MTSNSFDIAFSCTLAGAVAQVAMFILFGRWVNQRKDYYVFRRWRASMFIGSLMGLVFVGALPTIMLALALQTPHRQWSEVLTDLSVIATLVPLLACFVMPLVFLATLGFYIWIMHAFDVDVSSFDWLDQIWPPPDAAAGPPPIIREERFS
jgi:hypothetical protein